MKIDLDTVRKIADLAWLALDADEVARMQGDLDAILQYVDKLAELDTEGVPPTSHVVEIAAPLRGDDVADVLSVEEAIRNAPLHDDSSMLVPKVLE